MGQRGASPRLVVSDTLRNSRLLKPGRAADATPREAAIIVTLVNHPALIEPRLEQLAALDLASPAVRALMGAILDIVGHEHDISATDLADALGARGHGGALDRMRAQLRAQGVELGIISNFDSRLFPVMRGLGIEPLIDTVTISSLAQAAKPAPKIFQLALDKHAVDPEEAIHVGDSLQDDVEGAEKAGLHAVLLDREGRRRPAGVRSIRNLDELLPLIDRL